MTITKLIKTHLPRNSIIVMAFSGGPDSVFLLHKLLEIRKTHPFNIILAHFNHKLRGKDSDEDEKFSKETAKKFKIPFESASSDIKEVAKRNSLNLEEAARKKRYEFLEKVRKKYKADLILTAHHLDDNIETFFINFLRGAGIKGFKSMQIRNKNLLRPLLYITKEEILKFLKQKKVSYRIDSTNKDTKFTRNNIRLNIIPALLKIQPELHSVFLRNWEQTSEIFGFFNEFSGNWIKKNKIDEFTLPISKLRGLHPLLQKTVLQKWHENLYRDTKGLTSAQINRAQDAINNKETGKKIPFGKDFMLTVTSNSIKCVSKIKQKQITQKKLEIPGTTFYEYGKFKATFVKNQKSFKDAIYLDYQKLSKPLYVRSKKDGDAFVPFGMKGRKKLQDFFVDKKIPFYKRITIPVITDSKNNIVAIGTDIIAGPYKVLKSSGKILKLEVKQLEK